MATPPKPSVKAQRADQRAAKLEALRKKEAAQRRNRMIGLILGIIGIVAVLAIVTTVIVTSIQPPGPAEEPGAVTQIESGEVRTFDDLDAGHTRDEVDYDVLPPVGGQHDPGWLNCGVYDEVQRNEHAVHSLEHGAVWITYDPDEISDADLEALRELTPATYAILSPFPGLGDQIAISAWGAQLRVDDPADPALLDFIETYWQSADAPEPGAPCSGAIEGGGRVS